MGNTTEDCLSRLHEADISKVYWTEHGSGAEPKVNDVVAGDISVEVPPSSPRYSVSYGSGTGTVETFAVKNVAALVGAPPSTQDPASVTVPKYAWSEKSQFYHFADCAAVKRISPGNLRTGDAPPAGKQPSACVTSVAP